MWDAIRYANGILNAPTTRAWLLITILITLVITAPLARLLRWSVIGTAITLMSLGAAVTVTLANRVGRVLLSWEPEALADCIQRGGDSQVAPELLLNAVLLVPLGFGLYLASHRVVLSSLLVVAVAIATESIQAVAGLGCVSPATRCATASAELPACSWGGCSSDCWARMSPAVFGRRGTPGPVLARPSITPGCGPQTMRLEADSGSRS